MAQSDEIERERRHLLEMLKRVPPKVNAGSYDLTVKYKDCAKKAQKALQNTRIDAMGLMRVRVELEQFYS